MEPQVSHEEDSRGHLGRGCYIRRSSFSGRFVRSEIDIERIKLAVEAVASGLSLRKAAEKFSISKSVLHRYSKLGILGVMEKYMRNGPKLWN